MRKIFITFISFILFSCNNETEKTETQVKDTMAVAPLNTSGYMIDYSSSFKIGEPKNAETILALWKAWDEGNLEPTKTYFADSVKFFTYDGAAIQGPIDSALSMIQEYRNSFSSVKSTVHAIMPLISTDKDQNWVCIWGTEVHSDKKGKIDSVDLQETWRFNNDGKADVLYQYSAKPPKSTN
jgi:hypothetical protein